MNVYSGGILAVFLFFQCGFVAAAKLRRNDLADVLWGLGFVIAILGGMAGFALTEQNISLGATEIALFACITIWALRLSYHIGRRFLSHPQEDARYKKWREEWGSTWKLRSYLQVFTLQPAILVVIVLPALRALTYAPQNFSVLTGIGLAVWIFGFIFESVGDRQLRKFTADPQNKGYIMDRGLWSWSRHPNYFGEVTQWWGIFLMAFTPWGWWLVISPLTITFMILKVSGVTMLEDLMKNRPGFADYKRKTSIFIPWPPKATENKN